MPILTTSSGTYFYVDKLGNRDKLPLLLIHGAGSTHLTWPAELRRLRDRRVIALDLPGHGRSSGPGRSSIQAYAQSVCEFMNALGLSQAVIVGHSMGGAIAQTVAINLRRLVMGLILMGTGSHLAVNPALLEAALNDTEAMATMLYKWMWGPDADEDLKLLSTQQLLMIEPQIVHDDYQACAEFDLTDNLTQITAPTLILIGDKDKMTRPKLSYALHEAIVDSQLSEIESAGHMLPLEKPEIVTSIVETWLDEQQM